MSWATPHLQKLSEGQTIEFRPHGNSMKPRIKSGDLVVIEPVSDEAIIKTSDVVLCKVKGRYYLHLVSAVRDGQFQISNNHGFVNGWISRTAIFGRLVQNKGK